MRKITTGLCSVILLQCCSTTTPTQPPQTTASTDNTRSAKALFFETEETGSKGLSVVQQKDEPSTGKHKQQQGSVSQYQGLSYWIERIGRDSLQRVTSSTVFHDGDRIRLHLRTNHTGYLYVVAQGTSGRSAYLFPSKTGESEYIEANRNYDIPAQGYITFDNHPGKEVMWLFLSKQPLPVNGVERTESPSGGASTTNLALNSCGSKDLLIASPEAIQTQCGPKSGGQAKDILVQDDNSSTAPAAYAVIAKDQLDQGAMLSLKLELRHE